MRTLLAVLFCCLAALPCRADDTLDEIKSRQMLRCGVSTDYPGLAFQDDQGRWSGIEIDFCRAMAAALFADTAKVAFQPLPIQGRFSSLLSKEVDLLARNTSQTVGREAQLGVLFAGPLFITGQSFLVRTELAGKDLTALNNAPICVLKGTTHAQQLEDLAAEMGLHFQPVILENGGKALEAFTAGRCVAITEDATLLAAGRMKIAHQGLALSILPGHYSREMISLAVRQADPRLLLIIKAVLSALLTAEEIGFTGEMARLPEENGTNNATRIFLRRTDALAAPLGLKPGWAARVIGAVGHYGELYEHNLGAKGPLQLERGPNRLVRDGGMLYAVPF